MPTLIVYLQKATKGAPARRRCRMIAGAAALTEVLPLAVPLGGCGHPSENSQTGTLRILSLAVLRIACRHPGCGHPRRDRDQFGAAGSRHRGRARKGDHNGRHRLHIAAAIFIMGAALGLVAVVSIGVRHEERLFGEERRYRRRRATGRDRTGPSSIFSAVPPSRVCHGARVAIRNRTKQQAAR